MGRSDLFFYPIQILQTLTHNLAWKSLGEDVLIRTKFSIRPTTLLTQTGEITIYEWGAGHYHALDHSAENT